MVQVVEINPLGGKKIVNDLSDIKSTNDLVTEGPVYQQVW